jgi:hypothetical protein
MTNTQYKCYREELTRIRDHNNGTRLMPADKAITARYQLTDRARTTLCKRDQYALSELAIEYSYMRMRDMHLQSYILGNWYNSPFNGNPTIAEEAMRILKTTDNIPRRWIWISEKPNYIQ